MVKVNLAKKPRKKSVKFIKEENIVKNGNKKYLQVK